MWGIKNVCSGKRSGGFVELPFRHAAYAEGNAG